MGRAPRSLGGLAFALGVSPLFEHGSLPGMGGSGDAEAGAAPGLYLVVDDVEGVFELVVAAGAEVVFGPEETGWGTKRARFRDLDGCEWSIGSYRPGTGWG